MVQEADGAVEFRQVTVLLRRQGLYLSHLGRVRPKAEIRDALRDARF